MKIQTKAKRLVSSAVAVLFLGGLHSLNGLSGLMSTNTEIVPTQ